MYDFEDIDDYIHDRMSESDRLEFERVLQTDTELAQRVEALRAEKKVLRLIRDEHLLTKFAEWEEELAEKKTPLGSSSPTGDHPIITRNRWIIPIAVAAVLGIAGIGLYNYWIHPSAAPQPGDIKKPEAHKNAPAIDSAGQKTLPTPPTSPPDNKPDNSERAKKSAEYAALGNKEYVPHAFKVTLMGDHDNTVETNLTRAIKLYDAKKYQDALELLKTIDSAQKQQYLFLRAYTFYHLQRYAEAENDFRAFRDYKFSQHKYDAQWGEVFSLLKQLPSAAARKRLDAVLKEMLEESHPYHDQAVSLLERLKKIDG